MSKLACIYIRVSTSDQEEYSPEAQIRLLQEYAAQHDIVIGKIYQDLGISGRKADKRPEFKEMIAECKSKEHPFDVILVWKFSRFARNQEESIVYKSLLKRNNVDVISVSEPLPDGFIGKLVERIFEWMDEYYSIRLSGEVKRGMTQKALSGGYNAPVPIGYKKQKGSDTIPYIDDYYGEMVKLCFYMWTYEKKSFADIAYTINQQGYRTRRGNLWESRNICDMIQNPFYIGKIRWNNTENRSRQLTGETIIVNGKHPPLIDQGTFNMANERYQSISATQNHSKRSYLSEKHWLSGMIKCSACGGSLTYQKGAANKQGKYNPYFTCSRAMKGMCGTHNTISVAKAETYVMDSLKTMKGNEQLVLTKSPKHQQDTSVLAEQIKLIKKKINRAKDAYINGIDTIEEYKENKSRLETQLHELENTYREKIPAPTIVTTEKIRNVYEFILTSQNMTDKAAALRDIVNYIVYDKETDSMKFYMH